MIINVPKKEIIFEDRHPLMGMSSDTIFNAFFKLHAENLARKRFVNVRGKYGTGKVASFGINADYFTVDSVHKGLRTTVKATKKAFFSGEKPKLDVINVDEKANNVDNGTTVSISLANAPPSDWIASNHTISERRKPFAFGRASNNFPLESSVNWPA